MKIAFLLGFYQDVQRRVEADFRNRLKAGQIIWIPQVGLHREANLERFKGIFLDRSPHSTEVLILVALLAGKDWMRSVLDEIVAEGQRRNPSLKTSMIFEANARAADQVAEVLRSFSFDAIPEVSELILEQDLANSKILCVRASFQSDFEAAFLDAGFPAMFFDRYCLERRIDSGKNSNLISEVSDGSGSCQHLLYAWDGLRTLPADIKRRFCGIRIERRRVIDAVAEFKKHLIRK